MPSGLPKSVEDSIPHTPAGDRVRKGFQAITAHDWKVALAWFQDALNHEPNDPGLKRLVDLAQYTLQRESQPASATPSGKTGKDLNGALKDFNQNFFSNHPEIKASQMTDEEFLKAESPAYVEVFRYITSKFPKPKEKELHPAALGNRG